MTLSLVAGQIVTIGLFLEKLKGKRTRIENRHRSENHSLVYKCGKQHLILPLGVSLWFLQLEGG